MSNLKGKRIVLTGAAGGIGQCAAENFAKAGSVLILTDVNKAALDKLGRELRKKFKVKVYTRVVDVSKQKDVKDFATWTTKTLGGIDILINNAGIGHSGELAETSLDTWKQLFDINFWGPLYHVYSFLPFMVKQGHGHIVNVASGQAFFRLPTWGAYSVAKLAIGAFSELLRIEVKKLNIDVTTFYPFMVNTGLYDGIEGDNFFQKLSMKMVPYYSMAPKKVGKILFNAVKKKKALEMVSPLNTIAKLTRFVPAVSDIMGLMIFSVLGKKPEDIRSFILCQKAELSKSAT
jgi:short-subunit dehydrogenase